MKTSNTKRQLTAKSTSDKAKNVKIVKKPTPIKELDTNIKKIISLSIKSFDRLTPHPISREEFNGNGVYALYYDGDHPLYKEYKAWNKKSLQFPIYIGKAIEPKKNSSQSKSKTNKADNDENVKGLFKKIKEQYRNIAKVKNLNPGDFYFKALVVDTNYPSVADAIEGALVNHYQPLWNTCIDGFASHNPGKTRSKQSPSDWDVLHPGREWVKSLTGKSKDSRKIKRRVLNYSQTHNLTK
jgi:hypothetical protein